MDIIAVSSNNQKIMMRRFMEDTSRIFLACGSTNFNSEYSGLDASSAIIRFYLFILSEI